MTCRKTFIIRNGENLTTKLLEVFEEFSIVELEYVKLLNISTSRYTISLREGQINIDEKGFPEFKIYEIITLTKNLFYIPGIKYNNVKTNDATMVFVATGKPKLNL